ncbi:hypothetical protein NDU88_005865 [Pleurodeles waltl]|uniref:Uncharacterized protein n=1 Tax=Pleurodeles waltl TaxID=8319 RepID=A0AAV7PGS9_PLEWA|nr:hypothetical protein NDU88_005865 [Pleurodeles waltl]
MYSGVRAAGSLLQPSSPQSRFVSFWPTGARATKLRAGVPSVTHSAAASAGEPLTSGSAKRRSPGRHLEFIEPVAAGVYSSGLPIFVSGGDPWGPGADGHT